jgi:serine/threonine protein kinase
VEEIYREAQALQKLSHSNIVKLYHAFLLKSDVVLIMEYVSGGELYQYVKEKNGLSEVEARKIFMQLAYTVEYCHNKYIIHRDLKPANILISDTTTLGIKLIDFGISGSNYEKDKSRAGSLAYMPPEVLSSLDTTADPAIDVWALGIILYFMLYAKLPFNGHTEKEIKKEILNHKVEFRNKKITGECKRLIEAMLVKDPKKRMKVIDALESEWLIIPESKLLDPLPNVIEKPKLLLGNKSFSQSFKIPLKSARQVVSKKAVPIKKVSQMHLTPRLSNKNVSVDHKLSVSKVVDK